VRAASFTFHWKSQKVQSQQSGSSFAAIPVVHREVEIYVVPGGEILLYLRKYAYDKIKYFISNAAADLPVQELDRVATLRWSIEHYFEEFKSNLGIGYYECRSYQGWNRHMLFVIIAHFSIDAAYGGKINAWDHNICSNRHEKNCMLPYTKESLRI